MIFVWLLNRFHRFIIELGKSIDKVIKKKDSIVLKRNSIHFLINRNSPAQIRTGVKGSKGLYAWPLHSALVILPGFRAFLYCKYGHY